MARAQVRHHGWILRRRARRVRVRVEITGSQKSRNVGESQTVLVMIDPIISPRTRISGCQRFGHPRRLNGTGLNATVSWLNVVAGA
jgi:hypothetical protein